MALSYSVQSCKSTKGVSPSLQAGAKVSPGSDCRAFVTSLVGPHLGCPPKAYFV